MATHNTGVSECTDIGIANDQQVGISVKKTTPLSVVSKLSGAVAVSHPSAPKEQRTQSDAKDDSQRAPRSLNLRGNCDPSRFSQHVKRQLNFGQVNARRLSQGDGSFTEAQVMYDGSFLGKVRDYDNHTANIGLYDEELWGKTGLDTSGDMLAAFDTRHNDNSGRTTEYGQHFVGDQSATYQPRLPNRVLMANDHYRRAPVSYVSRYSQQNTAYQSEYSAMASESPYSRQAGITNASLGDPFSTQADRTLELEYWNSFSNGMHDFGPIQPSRNNYAVSILAPTSLAKDANGRSPNAVNLVSTQTGQRPNSGRTNRQPTEGKLLSTVSLSETDKRKISILTKPGKTRKTSLLSFTMHSDSVIDEQMPPIHARKRTMPENELKTMIGGTCVQDLSDRNIESVHQVADVSSREKINTPKSIKHNDVTSARCRVTKDHGCSSMERNSAIIHELLTSEREDSYPVFVVRQNSSISSTGDVKKDPSIIAVQKNGRLESRASVSVINDHGFMSAPLGNNGISTNSVLRRKIRQAGPRPQRRVRSKSASVGLAKTGTTQPTDAHDIKTPLSEKEQVDRALSKDDKSIADTVKDTGNDVPSDATLVSSDVVLPAHGRRAWSCDTGSILRRRVGPRRPRERVRNGRRLGVSGITPKRSPRLLLKTRLADRPDNHLDDFVYQSLKRKDDNTKTPKGRRIRSVTNSGTESANPHKKHARRSLGSANNEDIFAASKRSKSETPDKDGCSAACPALLPDSGLRKRRLGGTELLNDARLGKHACLLWSSEQRRRFQQENPEANSEELDTIMRRYWEQLGEKDRLRYYQRARNAVCDRLRHTSTAQRQGVPVRERPRDDATFVGDTGVAGFDRLPVARQHRLLKDLLVNLQRQLPRRQYHLVMCDYAASFRMAREQVARKRGAGAKHAQIYQQSWLMQVDNIARRLLYVKLKEATPGANRMLRHRRAVIHRQMAALYRGVVYNLLGGGASRTHSSEELATSHPVSARLTETLSDLNEIIADDTDSSDKSTLSADDKLRIDAISRDLQDGQYVRTMCDEIVPRITNTYFEKRILHDSKHGDLTSMSSDDVENFFKSVTSQRAGSSDTGSVTSFKPADLMLAHAQTALYRDVSGLDKCCTLNDPSCILNHLLIIDKLQRRDAERSS